MTDDKEPHQGVMSVLFATQFIESKTRLYTYVWSSGMILAFGSGDPGSIPGLGTLQCLIT